MRRLPATRCCDRGDRGGRHDDNLARSRHRHRLDGDVRIRYGRLAPSSASHLRPERFLTVRPHRCRRAQAGGAGQRSFSEAGLRADRVAAQRRLGWWRIADAPRSPDLPGRVCALASGQGGRRNTGSASTLDARQGRRRRLHVDRRPVQPRCDRIRRAVEHSADRGRCAQGSVGGPQAMVNVVDLRSLLQRRCFHRTRPSRQTAAGCPNEADVQHGRGRRQSDVSLRHAAGLHCGQTDRPSESVLLSGYERDLRTGQGRWCRLRRVGTRRDGSRGGQSRKRSAQQTSSLSRRKSPPARRSNRSIQDDIEVSTHHVAPWPGWRADRRVGRRAPRPQPSTTSGRCIRPFWSPAT